jgi:GcrA cell cycle regulator
MLGGRSPASRPGRTLAPPITSEPCNGVPIDGPQAHPGPPVSSALVVNRLRSNEMSAVPFLPVAALHLAGGSEEPPAPLPPWTVERVARLRELHGDLLWTPRRIAEDMGTTRNAVLGKLYRLGLCDPSKTPREKSIKFRPERNGQAAMAAIMARVSREEKKRARLAAKKDKSSKGKPPMNEPLPYDDSIPVSQRRSFMELTKDTCRYPVGDVGTERFFFCGAAPVDGLPYCSKHAGLCYQADPRRISVYIPRR